MLWVWRWDWKHCLYVFLRKRNLVPFLHAYVIYVCHLISGINQSKSLKCKLIIKVNVCIKDNNSINRLSYSVIIFSLNWILAFFTSVNTDCVITCYFILIGACSSIVGWGTMLQAWRSQIQVLMRWISFIWHNPSSCTMALGSTDPLNRNDYQESSWW
jgi:hypothetical protein